MESLAEDWHRNWASFSGMVRVVSNAREGSKNLTFLFRSRLVCNSLPHLLSSWKVGSANVALCAFCDLSLYGVLGRSSHRTGPTPIASRTSPVESVPGLAGQSR